MRALILFLSTLVLVVLGANKRGVDPELRKKNQKALHNFLNHHKKKKDVAERTASEQIMSKLHEVMDSVPANSERHAKIQAAYNSLEAYSNSHPQEWAKTAQKFMDQADQRGPLAGHRPGPGSFAPGGSAAMSRAIRREMSDPAKRAAMMDKIATKYQKKK